MKDVVMVLAMIFALAAVLFLAFPWLALGMIRYMAWVGTFY